jgi:ferredoxin
VDTVTRALGEIDAWLLVANSRGINVWCAAAGGHLNTHAVIAALKTTGVADRVDHRRLVLPQLAATGVQTDLLRARTGWESVWGPVYVEDLPDFLLGKEKAEMREVRFDLCQRLEMALMWATPLSALALVTLLFWPDGLLPLLALIWGLTLAVYGAFPLYEGLVRRGSLVGTVALFGGLAVAGVATAGVLTGHRLLSFVLRWGGLALTVVLLLAFDLAGSTPLFKSWSHEERGYGVELDEEVCTRCGRCAQVCPRGVFTVAEAVSLAGASSCVQCGACIVQCPADALAFVTPSGVRVPPENTRRYKLNLMGRRSGLSDGVESIC